MTRPVIAISDFNNFSPASLVTFTRDVITAMTGNSAYPSPDVDMRILTDQADALERAIITAQANTGSLSDTAAMDAAEKTLLASLRRQVRYVNHISYNDEVAILSSGFHVSATESRPAARPSQPGLKVQPLSDAGAVSLNIDPVAGAKSFTAIIGQDGVSVALTGAGIEISGPVVMASDTHRKITVAGLKSGVRYKAWVYATGTAGVSSLSDGKSFVTQ